MSSTRPNTNAGPRSGSGLTTCRPCSSSKGQPRARDFEQVLVLQLGPCSLATGQPRAPGTDPARGFATVGPGFGTKAIRKHLTQSMYGLATCGPHSSVTGQLRAHDPGHVRSWQHAGQARRPHDHLRARFQGMFEICNLQAMLVGHKANCERLTQNLLEVCNMQAMLIGHKANRRNLPQSRRD